MDSDEEVEEEDEFAGLSRFEKEQRRMRSTIEKLEDFNVAEKPWQLSGGTLRSLCSVPDGGIVIEALVVIPNSPNTRSHYFSSTPFRSFFTTILFPCLQRWMPAHAQ